MPKDRMPQVAVIGGGIAGLVAAWELSQHDIEVHVYERGEHLGGRVCRKEILGRRYDVGAESFALRGGGVAALLDDLGLAEFVQTPRPLRSWVIHPDVSAPLPRAGVLGIPVAAWRSDARRVLGVRGAVRAAIEPLLPRRYGKGAKTVAEAVRRRFGARVLTRLVAPVVRGVYSSDPEVLALTAVPGLAEAWESHRSLTAAARALRKSSRPAGAAVAGLRGGMGVLVDELERQLRARDVTIHRQTAVTSITPTGAGLRLHIETASTDGDLLAATTERPVQAAIVTVPGVRAASHDEQHGAVENRSTASQPEPAATIDVVALLLDDPRLTAAPRGTGALVAAEAHCSDRPIVAKALTHSSAKWGWLADELPRDRHVIRLSYGGHTASAARPRAAGVGALDDDAMRRLACRDASRILGMPLREDQVVGMARQSHVIPQRTAAGAKVSPDVAGMFRAGEWVAGTGLATVIPSARNVARECGDFVSRKGSHSDDGGFPMDSGESTTPAPRATEAARSVRTAR